jgi:hypothetical protein
MPPIAEDPHTNTSVDLVIDKNLKKEDAGAISGRTLFLNFVSGGVANATASAILNPMDVSKTRMQAENMKGNAVKTTLFDNFKILYTQGGLVGLWKPGLKASMMRDMASSGLRAGFYVPVRNIFNDLLHEDGNSKAVKILAAITTGTMGALLANPIDVVKIRLMVNPQAYPSISNAFSTIVSTEGMTALYKGLFPSTLRGACVSVGEYATYDIAKTILKNTFHLKEGPVVHTISSLVAGLVATTIAAPLDLLKTRAMNTLGKPAGMAETLVLIVKQEGGRALFRGWLPAYLRLGPHALITFPIFEQLRKMMNLSHI